MSDSGASTDGAPADGGEGCIKPPSSVTPDDIPFRNAYAEISSRCGACEGCRQLNANSCYKLGSTLSASFRDGITACKDVVTCDPFFEVSMLGTNRANGAGRDACGANYFGMTDGGPGLGGLMLVSSDSITEQVANNCSTTCAPANYAKCELGLFCVSAGKDECGQSTLCN